VSKVFVYCGALDLLSTMGRYKTVGIGGAMDSTLIGLCTTEGVGTVGRLITIDGF